MAGLAQNKKRIARNTFYLYCRKVVMILLGLYSSRLLLERLGDDGFGLFGLIGSVIVLFDSLRFVFTASIQRYVNVALSSGRAADVQKVFSLGMVIQLLLALGFAVIAEAAGFFIIPNLNIEASLMPEAHGVFQLSLLSAVVVMLTVPYEALLLAHERLGVFSVLALMESLLKFGAVLALAFRDTERVVWYAALLLCVSLIVRVANSVYCRRAFGEEVKFRYVPDRKLFKEMTFFAFWTFLGGTACSISRSGLNFVLNIFGGLGVNTARNLAVQIEGNALQFTRDVTNGFRPRSIIEYTAGQFEEFYSLMRWNTKVSFFIATMLCFVFCALAEPVVRLWLGEVPPYSVIFAQLIMLYTVVQSLYDPFDTLFRAAGKMKRTMITEACLMLTVVPVAWALLACGAPYYTAFVVLVAAEAVNFTAFLFIAQSQLSFPLGSYTQTILSRVFLTLLLLCGLYFLSVALIPAGIDGWTTAALLPVLAAAVAIIEFFSLFTASERGKLLELARLKKRE